MNPCQRRGGVAQDRAARLSARGVKEEWTRLVSDRAAGKLHAYVHIPFCARRCVYCHHHTQTLQRGALQAYCGRLLSQVRFYEDAFSRTPISSLFVGGGTPAVLSCRQIEAVFSCYMAAFPFRDDAVRTFEFTPGTVEAEKVRLLRQLGFSRVSMGVQTFGAATLQAMNRGDQSPRSVSRAADILHRAGFPHGFNLDLLAGFSGVEDALTSFESAARLEPSQITVNLLDRHPDGARKENLVRLHDDFIELAEKLPSLAADLGYGFRPVLGALRLLPTDPDWTFSRRGADGRLAPHMYGWRDTDDVRPLRRRNSVFAIGHSARSYLLGRAIIWEDTKAGNGFDPESCSYAVRRLPFLRCGRDIYSANFP